MENKLKAIRKALSYNQEDFARQLNISRSTIALIETKRNKLTSELIEKLISKYNISPNWLFDRSENMFLGDGAAPDMHTANSAVTYEEIAIGKAFSKAFQNEIQGNALASLVESMQQLQEFAMLMVAKYPTEITAHGHDQISTHDMLSDLCKVNSALRKSHKAISNEQTKKTN